MHVFVCAVAHPSEYNFFTFCKLTYFLPFSSKYYLIHGAYLGHLGSQANTILKKNPHSRDWLTLPGLTEPPSESTPLCGHQP